ncbi:Zinc finger protein 432, partial [Galemys pyrenaicus]
IKKVNGHLQRHLQHQRFPKRIEQCCKRTALGNTAHRNKSNFPFRQNPDTLDIHGQALKPNLSLANQNRNREIKSSVEINGDAKPCHTKHEPFCTEVKFLECGNTVITNSQLGMLHAREKDAGSDKLENPFSKSHNSLHSSDITQKKDPVVAIVQMPAVGAQTSHTSRFPADRNTTAGVGQPVLRCALSVGDRICTEEKPGCAERPRVLGPPYGGRTFSKMAAPTMPLPSGSHNPTSAPLALTLWTGWPGQRGRIIAVPRASPAPRTAASPSRRQQRPMMAAPRAPRGGGAHYDAIRKSRKPVLGKRVGSLMDGRDRRVCVTGVSGCQLWGLPRSPSLEGIDSSLSPCLSRNVVSGSGVEPASMASGLDTRQPAKLGLSLCPVPSTGPLTGKPEALTRLERGEEPWPSGNTAHTWACPETGNIDQHLQGHLENQRMLRDREQYHGHHAFGHTSPQSRSHFPVRKNGTFELQIKTLKSNSSLVSQNKSYESKNSAKCNGDGKSFLYGQHEGFHLAVKVSDGDVHALQRRVCATAYKGVAIIHPSPDRWLRHVGLGYAPSLKSDTINTVW